MYRHGLGTLVCILLLTEGATTRSAQKDADKTPDKQLEGQWQAIKLFREERELPKGNALLPVMTIKGNTYSWKQGKTVRPGTITVDSSKNPKTVDVKITGGILKGEMILAVYEVKGDELRWCQSDLGNTERPPGLATKKGTDALLFFFRRVKP